MPISNGSLEDENCSVITDWGKTDLFNGVSSQCTYDGEECFCFDTNGHQVANVAQRNKDVGSIDGLGNRFIVSLRLYCDAVGAHTNLDYFHVMAKRSDMMLVAIFASDGLFIHDGNAYNEVGDNLVQQDMWQIWTFDVDVSGGAANAVCDVYLGDVLKASNVNCSYTGTFTDGGCILGQHGWTIDDQISYVDWFKVGDAFYSSSSSSSSESSSSSSESSSSSSESSSSSSESSSSSSSSESSSSSSESSSSSSESSSSSSSSESSSSSSESSSSSSSSESSSSSSSESSSSSSSSESSSSSSESSSRSSSSESSSSSSSSESSSSSSSSESSSSSSESSSSSSSSESSSSSSSSESSSSSSSESSSSSSSSESSSSSSESSSSSSSSESSSSSSSMDMTLVLDNFSIEVGEWLPVVDLILFSIDVVDYKYDVNVSGTYFLRGGEIVPTSYSGIDNGYRCYYYPPTVSGAINLTIHAENSNSEIKEEDYYLLYGYNCKFNELIDWGYKKEVVTTVDAKNLAFCPNTETAAFFFETADLHSRNLGAILQAVEYVDLQAFIRPQSTAFFYGQTYTIKISGIRDFAGNEMQPFSFNFIIENK